MHFNYLYDNFSCLATIKVLHFPNVSNFTAFLKKKYFRKNTLFEKQQKDLYTLLAMDKTFHNALENISEEIQKTEVLYI